MRRIWSSVVRMHVLLVLLMSFYGKKGLISGFSPVKGNKGPWIHGGLVSSPSGMSSQTRTTEHWSRLHVAVDPMRDQENKRVDLTKNGRMRQETTLNYRRRVNPRGRSLPQAFPTQPVVDKSFKRRHGKETAERSRSAVFIEAQLISASDALRTCISRTPPTELHRLHPISFPSVRECNEALAAFGDAGDLLRALRLFGKMRKLKQLKERLSSISTSSTLGSIHKIPVPSLVTYSTLMSRAVKLSKPRVALRLWDIMCPTITPDVKAANILMNCFAKLANVERAKQLLQEIKTGTGPTISTALTPNLVTINTLLDACHKAGDLDSALEVQLELDALGIRPDARTYTTLIATVARGKSQHSGKNDPSLAFALLEEMREKHIQPNGMTYSALIDVCGRCRRSDLALQGLRIMMRQKAQEQAAWKKQTTGSFLSNNNYYTLPNEVGAWTAAIDACGKAKRIETATKLFYAMPNFGCEPNTITCGCLTDSLLRAGRTAETLKVLRYMKRNDIEPSEVMYTSLMTRADRLVQMENNYTTWAVGSMEQTDSEQDDPMGSNETSGTKAIEVYTELMLSLIATQSFPNQRLRRRMPRGGTGSDSHGGRPEKDNNSAVLVKVFLVFQQMKASGAVPDIACYNALLKACARAGEFSHGMRIMEELESHQELEPNDKSWRELLKAASVVGRSDLALQVWNRGLLYHQKGKSSKQSVNNTSTASNKDAAGWVPSIPAFSEFLSAFVAEAEKTTNPRKCKDLLTNVVQFYCKILLHDDNAFDEDGMHLIDQTLLLANRRAMLLILRATVNLRDMYGASTEQGKRMEKLSKSIIQLESFEDIRSQRLSWRSFQALEEAQSWLSLQDAPPLSKHTSTGKRV